MKTKKTRLVVDIPLHIKRVINRVQEEAQETMLAFTDALQLLEMAQDPEYATLMETQPLSPEEMNQISALLLTHWERFLQSVEALQDRTRRWGEADELDEETIHDPEDQIELDFDLDLGEPFQASDIPGA